MTAKEFFEKNADNAQLKAAAAKAAEGGAESFENYLKEQGVEVDLNELLALSIDAKDGAVLDDGDLENVAGGVNLGAAVDKFLSDTARNWGITMDMIGSWLNSAGKNISDFLGSVGNTFAKGVNSVGNMVNKTVDKIFGRK